jgi:hypothetical protein
VPRRFIELINDEDPARVGAVMQAMMKMVKLDVAALESAYDAAGTPAAASPAESA